MSGRHLTQTANSPLHLSFLPNATTRNRRVVRAYRALGEADYRDRSHYIDGRFENVYVETARIPELRLILAHAQACAREILALDDRPLRSGLWFNDMGPGQSTSEHTHEEHDELLSAVYYLEVPENSGDLVLLDRWSSTRLTPRAGMFVFFAPSLPHRVETNRSGQSRLSLGINIGPGEEP